MRNIYIQKLSILIIIVCSAFTVLGQEKPIFSNTRLSNFLVDNPGELVYIHTDRELYANTDTVWFKAYLVNAYSHIPQNGLRNVYVELINSSGTTLIRNLIQMKNGSGNGDLNLGSYDLKRGTYVMRAYTTYQQNFGENFIFKKNIKIERIDTNEPITIIQSGKSTQVFPNDTTQNIDIQFLPECGYLTSNLANTVAFKACASNGKSIEISGVILNELGNEVARFKTSHKGMGKFRFFPQKGKKYTAKIDGFPDVEYKLPVSTDKVQLVVDTQSDSMVYVKILRNSYQNTKIKYYIVNSFKGQILFYLPVETDISNVRFKLNHSQFGFGINQLTLTDENFRPIAERLIFVKKDELLGVKLEADKSKYANREKVNVAITSFAGAGCLPANFSVSVVNERQAIALDDYPQNILSYLLLDSELKGYIENPSYYFSNDSASTDENLDLLMLTQGWRNYNWNEFKDTLPSTEFIKESGLVVSGRLKRLLGKKGAENGKVTLFMRGEAGNFYISETVSDSLGSFKFPPAIFPDSVNAFIQGLNKRNKKYTEIIDVASFSPPAPFELSQLYFPTFDSVSKNDFIRKAYIRLADDKEFHPDKYNILLDDIDIIEKANPFEEEDDGHFRMYGRADDVLVVDDNAGGYSDIWSFMAGRIAGVNVSGNSVTIRGGVSFSAGGNTPHFLLDGVPVDKEMIDGISLYEVDKIEVLKDVSSLALFGVQGANGVIAVYTKRGGSYVEEQSYTGIINDKLRGYYLSREFYSPNYHVDSPKQPDHRATLYWNPNVNTDTSGKAAFSFFMSDDDDPVIIKVEGISNNGKPGVGFLKLKKNN